MQVERELFNYVLHVEGLPIVRTRCMGVRFQILV